MPKNFWHDIRNQQDFLNWLSRELGINTMEDWYNVTYNDIYEYGGNNLLQFYSNSHIDLIMSSFPNYKWLPWKFGVVPKNYWSQIENQTEYVNWLGDQLGIVKKEDWYNISQQVIVTINYH